MSGDIKVGEVRTVFPPEGTPNMRAFGQVIEETGTPLRVTNELLTLYQNKMLRIGDATDAQPAQEQPSVQEAPQQPEPRTPAVAPHEAFTQGASPSDQSQSPPQQQDQQTPEQAKDAPPETGTTQAQEVPSLPTADQIDSMNDDELREFVTSIGHDPTNRKRPFLLRVAKNYVEEASKIKTSL